MKVYTQYSDGIYWLNREGVAESPNIDIKLYQWWLYKIVCWIDTKCQNWLVDLDNEAYRKLDENK